MTTVPLSLYCLLGGQMRYMRSQGFTVWMASADGPEVTDLVKREGCPHIALPLTRRMTLGLDLLALWKVYRLFRRLRPDLVHTHTPKAGLIGMVAGWLARVPIRLHTVAGLPLTEYGGLMRWLLMSVERITYCCATDVYPNSKGLLRYIETHIYRCDSKLRLIGHGSTNGIDCWYFRRTLALEARAQELRMHLTIGQEEFVWLYVGRIVRQKGINELITAYCRLATDPIEATMRLWLVGSFETHLDPLSEESMHLINTRPDIIVIDFQLDIRPYLLAADALVFPSYREGFPNVLMQAACMEVPLIATDIIGCNDLVTHEQNGLLVPPKDTAALMQAMERLWIDDALRLRLASLSRIMMEDYFEQQKMWEQYLAEYRRLLARR